MVKTIQKVTVETNDDGKIETTVLHKDNVKSINWGEIGNALGDAMKNDPPPGL